MSLADLQCVFDRYFGQQAFAQKFIQACAGDADSFRQGFDRKLFAAPHNRRAPVRHLQSGRCPSAITGLIIPINIDPVKGQAVWPLTHITHKLLKRIAPFGTHLDAASAVLRKVAIRSDITPRLRGTPRAISFIRTETVRAPVGPASVANLLPTKTATTGSIAAGKFVPHLADNIATFAKANPSRPSAFRSGSDIITSLHRKPPVNVARPVNKCAHKGGSNGQ